MPGDGKKESPEKIDICLLTYNSAEIIESCLEGARAAMGDALGMFRIVDNGSTDETLDLIEHQMTRHHDIDFEVRPELTMGQARARSYQMARTIWLVQLDSDIVLRKDYLRRLKTLMLEDVGGAEPLRMNHYSIIQSNKPWRSLGGQNLMRRSLLPKEIPYDMCGEDEYTRRFIEDQGYKWVFMDEVLVDHYPYSEKYKSGHFLARYSGGADSWASLDRRVRHAPFHKQYVSLALTWLFWVKWHTRDFLLKCLHYARGWRSLPR